jgi:hypothetical protein
MLIQIIPLGFFASLVLNSAAHSSNLWRETLFKVATRDFTEMSLTVTSP